MKKTSIQQLLKEGKEQRQKELETRLYAFFSRLFFEDLQHTLVFAYDKHRYADTNIELAYQEVQKYIDGLEEYDFKMSQNSYPRNEVVYYNLEKKRRVASPYFILLYSHRFLNYVKVLGLRPFPTNG